MKKKALTGIVIVGSVLLAVLGAPLAVGVWLPDAVIGWQCTLAEQRLASGHSFRVIQYWNHGDFYNTELVHTSPAGAIDTHVPDYDDTKSWSVPLAVDEGRKTVTVVLGGGRVKEIGW